jgi:subtilisin family serine protease
MCNEKVPGGDLESESRLLWLSTYVDKGILPDKIEIPDRYKKEHEGTAKEFAENCAKHKGLEKLSGTSMATPFVSRIAGMVFAAHPNFSGAQAIQTIKSEARASKAGALPISVVSLDMPSWYPKKPAELPTQFIFAEGPSVIANDPAPSKFDFKVIVR